MDVGATPGSDASAIVPSHDAAPSNDPRAQAATAPANGNPSCVSIQPFYWEIGSQDGRLVGGTASQTGATTPAANTQMLIASASKWIFGAYVIERRAGQLAANPAALSPPRRLFGVVAFALAEV